MIRLSDRDAYDQCSLLSTHLIDSALHISSPIALGFYLSTMKFISLTRRRPQRIANGTYGQYSTVIGLFG